MVPAVRYNMWAMRQGELLPSDSTVRKRGSSRSESGEEALK
jgi:hypothetical protein